MVKGIIKIRSLYRLSDKTVASSWALQNYLCIDRIGTHETYLLFL